MRDVADPASPSLSLSLLFAGTEEEAGAKGFGKTDASVGEVVIGSEQEGALVGVGRGEEREAGEEGMETEGVCSDTRSNGSSLGTAGEGQPGTEGAAAMAMDESEGYQKVEFAVLYYHSTTGYYYDPVRTTHDHTCTNHTHIHVHVFK